MKQDPKFQAAQQIARGSSLIDAPIGESIEVFRPGMSNIIAGFFLGALLIIGGAAAIAFPWRAAYLAHWSLPLQVERGWSWFAVGMFSVIGVALISGGIAVGVFVRGLLSHCVEICRDGFRFKSKKSAVAVPWKLVTCIRETNLYERPPLLKGPAKLLIPKFVSSSYLVFVATGKEYAFDGNSVREIKRFSELLRNKASELSLKWETVEDGK